MTLFTLADALFPDPLEGNWAWTLKNWKCQAPGTRRKPGQPRWKMDREEETFAAQIPRRDG